MTSSNTPAIYISAKTGLLEIKEYRTPHFYTKIGNHPKALSNMESLVAHFKDLLKMINEVPEDKQKRFKDQGEYILLDFMKITKEIESGMAINMQPLDFDRLVTKMRCCFYGVSLDGLDDMEEDEMNNPSKEIFNSTFEFLSKKVIEAGNQLTRDPEYMDVKLDYKDPMVQNHMRGTVAVMKASGMDPHNILSMDVFKGDELPDIKQYDSQLKIECDYKKL